MRSKVQPIVCSPPMAHLHPTAALAERALLPDDPGQALALTRMLYEETPRMFNHHRGLWGYSGIARDGAPLTVQSTGIGGPSAAVVVGELRGLGLRRAVRIGRAWAVAGLRAGDLVAATAVLARDGASRALGAGQRVEPDPALAEALDADHRGLLASADVARADPAWEGVLAFDLESAAVLAAARAWGVAAASLVAVEGAVDPEPLAKRLGRAALAALPSLAAS
jgi:uridine phosphorylase